VFTTPETRMFCILVSFFCELREFGRATLHHTDQMVVEGSFQIRKEK
jgi:hypothetical protein